MQFVCNGNCTFPCLCHSGFGKLHVHIPVTVSNCFHFFLTSQETFSEFTRQAQEIDAKGLLSSRI